MKSKRTLLILVGLSLSFAAGIVLYAQSATIDPIIAILYALIGIVALVSIYVAYTRYQEEKEGQPLEDEFSTQLKYKAGYYAYAASMYMWLFVFLFRDFIPNTETLVGGGILLSTVIAFVCKMIVKQNPDV